MSEYSHPLRKPVSLFQLAAVGAALALLTVVVGFVCSLYGPISMAEMGGWDFTRSIIWQDRLSRIVAAGLAGGALSVSGLGFQALLRNPLADPYVLGVSSGAGVGVISGLALASRWAVPAFTTTPVLAFFGALATCVAVYLAAQRRGHLDPYSLILCGVMINAMNSALILAVYLFIDSHTLSTFIGWSIGQVPDAVSFDHLLLCGVSIIAASSLVLLRGAAFNALALGDTVASSSGVPVGRLRFETFVAAGLLTACAVSLVGPIGFVGLLIPHLCRIVLGPDHRRLAVVCIFCGGAFLILCDTLCRIGSSAADLGKVPVGIITALTGGPFFIWLLRKRY
jgi:iron complex transport system permease protein